MTDRTLTANASLGDRIPHARPPHRLERLRGWMAEQSLDACVLAGPDHVAHLAGYTRYGGGPAALVVSRDGARTLLVNVKEEQLARERADVDEVIGCGLVGLGFEPDPTPALYEAVAATAPVRSAKRLGVADSLGGASAALRGAATIVEADAALSHIRLVHDEDELVKLLRGTELCWIAQTTVAELAVPGVREIELFSAAHAAAQNAHGAPVEFVADLLSGPDTWRMAPPMYVPGDRRVEAGDAVIADIVVGADGYWGDSAETHLAGENAEVAATRAALLEIRAECAAELRPGVSGAEVFASMDGRVHERFPDGAMPHHAGHGVALTSFEDPHLIPTTEMQLESWMLMALEPGVYFEGRYGARVENLYVVTPDGGVELRAAMGAPS